MPACDYTGPLRWVYDWQTIIAGVGAVFGGWLAYRAGVRQATATREATEASTRSMLQRSQLVERAYISGGGVRAREPSEISAAGVLSFRDTGEFEFHINNYGKTQGTLYRLGYGFCDEAAPPKAPAYTFEYYSEPIDPGRRGLPIARHRIPAEHNVPMVYGRFYYSTIFNTRHSSGFFYRILPNRDPQSVSPPTADFTRDRDEDES
jgi:hypothetical protein